MSINTLPESNKEHDGVPFPSVDALRAAHSQLLKRLRSDDDQPEFWDAVETFIERGRATGKVLNEDSDRWDTQSSLDYWSTLLFRKGRQPPDATLDEFDASFDPTLFPELDESQRPYIGLEAFNEAKSGLFFGRQKLVEEIVEGLKKNRWLSILGPPGSGKSSLVLAGILPALKEGKVPGSETWHYCPMMSPGSDPLLSLASLIPHTEANATEWVKQQVSGFLKSKTHLLQLINNANLGPTVIACDQFEEIFTLTSDESVRNAFIGNLLSLVEYPDLRHTVIITMRDAFEEYIVKLPELQPYFAANTVRVRPMNAAELREAIEKPAALAGLKFEEGVVDKLISEVLGEPAGLALLQFTLLKLWNMRQRNLVTWESFHTLGSCRGALISSAENFFKNLPEEDQSRVKKIMLRLLRWGEGLKVLSDRVPRNTLLTASETREQPERMLDKLIEAGLLRETKDAVSGTTQVEVSHEALIRDWPRLEEWLEDERTSKRQQLRLSIAAKRWDALKRDPNLLLRGSLLAEALRLENLPQLEDLYVQTSNQRRLLIRDAVVVSLMLLISILVWRMIDYRIQRNMARESAETGHARVLAYQARNRLNDQLDLALLLGLEAYKTKPTVEARASLLSALAYSPQITSFLHGHKGRVQSVAYSPDGKLLASGGVDGSIRLWDLSQPRNPPRILDEGGNNEDRKERFDVVSIAFIDGGKTLISASIVRRKSKEPVPGRDAVRIMLWDMATMTAREFPKENLPLESGIKDVVISDQGNLIGYLFEDGAISIWDAKGLRKLRDILAPTLTTDDGEDKEQPDGGRPNRLVRKTEKQVTADYKEVNVLAFSPDGKIIALGGTPLMGDEDSSLLTLWKMDGENEQVGNPIIVESSIQSLTLSEDIQDGQMVAAGDSDGIIHLWKIDDNILQPMDERPTGHIDVTSVAFNRNGQLLASGSFSGVITLFDLKTSLELKVELSQEPDPVYCLAFSPDGNTLVSRATSESSMSISSKLNPIKLWSVNESKLKGEINVRNASIFSLAFSPDNETCAWGDHEGVVTICKIGKDIPCSQKREIKFPVSNVTGPMLQRKLWVEGLAFSRDGKTLAAIANLADQEGKPNFVILWDLTSCDQNTCKERKLDGPEGALKSVAFSQDGKLLASGGHGDNENDNNLFLWDTETWKRTALTAKQDAKVSALTPEVEPSGINAVAFNPQGKLLASGGDNRAIILWDVETAQPVEKLVGKNFTSINSLSFNMDGSMLASGGTDKTINVWDVASRKQFAQLPGHSGSVRNVIFSPVSDKLASSGDGGYIILWDFDIDLWLKIAERIANRPFSDEEKRFYEIGKPF